MATLEAMLGSSAGTWNKASWKWGSNLSPFWGIICSSPCFKKTFCNCASVITSPSYRSRKCLFSCNSFSGTLCVACWRISATSSRSLQKPWIPKSRTSLTCFVIRCRTFSVSANARMYLSYNKIFINECLMISSTHICSTKNFHQWISNDFFSYQNFNQLKLCITIHSCIVIQLTLYLMTYIFFIQICVWFLWTQYVSKDNFNHNSLFYPASTYNYQ